MDYSSLDGDAQKRMMNFVKDQRKSYRKYESNETTAMTDQRCRLLTEAGFDFKPSETNKGKLPFLLDCQLCFQVNFNEMTASLIRETR